MLRLILRLSLVWAVTEALHTIQLGENTKFFWELDYATGYYVAEIHASNFDERNSWMGVGFSNFGNLLDGSGDFCIVWKNHLKQSSVLELTDVHLKNGTDKIEIDKQQDCLDFKHVMSNGTLKWTMRRKFVTCDYFDYGLEEGTTHLHWVYGHGPLFDIKGVAIHSVRDTGFERVRFMKNIEPPHSFPTDVWKFKILNANVKVPADETTYWCRISKLPERVLQKKHHIVQFGSYIQPENKELVHHMEVFHCLTDASVEIPMYNGPCDQSPPELKVCSQVLGAWAMGAEPLTLPSEAGYPIGGPGYNQYVRLEMHYNNPMLKPNWVDSSGMVFWVTEKLRKYDAGVMELGLEYTDKMMIPPKHPGFLLTGVCNRECTSVGLVPGGITIFASQLHTHLTGTRVVTRHLRPAKGHCPQCKGNIDEQYVELPYLNWDNHYSTHFQEIRKLKLPRKVHPGDVLLTTCRHNTTDREKPTLGGFAISEEMCVNYVHYYPKSELEVCKSSVSWTSLREYFHFMHTMEDQDIPPEGAVSENYNGIKWSPFRAQLLEDFYNMSPIDMQCNRSDGSRFPGNWDSMPVPAFPELSPPSNPNDECFLEDLGKEVVNT